jgi:hypothetical protein
VLDIWGNNDATLSALLARSEADRGTPDGPRADEDVVRYLQSRRPDALAAFPALYAAGSSPEFQQLMRELPRDEAQRLASQASDFAGMLGLTRRAATFRVDEPAVVGGPLHQVFAIQVRP